MIFERLPAREYTCDVCVVGSGPLGMALALELDRLGRDVVVLESGQTSVNQNISRASQATIANPQRHAQMEVAVCRALGGTSWAWGGLFVALDPVDFLDRSHVPHSGWPLGQADIERWYPQAAEYLLCGDHNFSSRASRLPNLGGDVSVDGLERWSTEPRLALVHRGPIERSERIKLFLNSRSLIPLRRSRRLGAGGCGSDSRRQDERKGARCDSRRGGIETTRSLLAVQRWWPRHFGGSSGPLAAITWDTSPAKSQTCYSTSQYIDDLDFELDRTGAFVRRRFSISAAAQQHTGFSTQSSSPIIRHSTIPGIKAAYCRQFFWRWRYHPFAGVWFRKRSAFSI